MTVEEALGRIARAKENTVMAQKTLKELWVEWMERKTLEKILVPDGFTGEESVDWLNRIIERLELALHDVKVVRDNLKQE